ncbi:MAG: cytochrome c-type biogenesis protein CcmH [Candidatus Tectomicrobia bacterium]|uniref:Cytochrome c-type biogenesis protein n=1 Tax=Tectimicrobiota bacterium TaxID=2528274 RepID=A0A932I0N2_UNCTE|nr:cytochrome c-type biogenesis protein CcmH [Candidatus Tectomicrobia bacterium]
MRFPGRLLLAPFLGGMLLLAAPGAWAAEPKAFVEPKTTVDEVTGAIMSPVCPGKLLHDCPSAEGAQLRELVRRKVVAGETKEQIVRYFVDVYGISVLPQPPAEGFLLTAWLLPLAGLIAGFGVVIVMVRAWTARGRARRERPAEKEEAGAGGGEDPLEDRLRRELKDFGN